MGIFFISTFPLIYSICNLNDLFLSPMCIESIVYVDSVANLDLEEHLGAVGGL